MNVTKPSRNRRTYSEAFKQSLIEAFNEPGASVTGLALANGIKRLPWYKALQVEGRQPSGNEWTAFAKTAVEISAAAPPFSFDAYISS